MSADAFALRREHGAIPGFPVALGITLTALCLIVLIPSPP